jgi:hypothetical protein
MKNTFFVNFGSHRELIVGWRRREKSKVVIVIEERCCVNKAASNGAGCDRLITFLA